jgi:hypothetical protein
MNARNNFKSLSDQGRAARVALAAAQLRFAARVDFLVARWLARCAANAEAAQRLFKTDRTSTRCDDRDSAFVVPSGRQA